MSEKKSRDVRRETLATLFALCPKGAEAADVMDVYLRATQDIPAPLFVDAVSSLIETWQWPNAPMPGDIRARASRIISAERRKLREQQREQELSEAYSNAMSPGQARQLLAELNAEGEPQQRGDRIAHKLRCHVLERVVARDRSLLLDAGIASNGNG